MNFLTTLRMPDLPLAKRVGLAISTLVPTSRVTVMNPLAQEGTLANTMTADRVHAVIEAAKGGDPRDLFALYRDILVSDSHLQSEFQKRKLALLGDPLKANPRDKKNADDIKAAEAINMMIDVYRAPNPADISSCPWLRACSQLLDGILWPVAMVEKVFQPSSIAGLQYELGELVMVPEHLLTYQTYQLSFFISSGKNS